jgi:hypothetical protein
VVFDFNRFQAHALEAHIHYVLPESRMEWLNIVATEGGQAAIYWGILTKQSSPSLSRRTRPARPERRTGGNAAASTEIGSASCRKVTRRFARQCLSRNVSATAWKVRLLPLSAGHACGAGSSGSPASMRLRMSGPCPGVGSERPNGSSVPSPYWPTLTLLLVAVPEHPCHDHPSTRTGRRQT